MKKLAVISLWLVILTILGVSYKLIYKPKKQQEEVVAKKKVEKEILQATSSPRHYTHTVRLALDSFSGYAVFRSSEFNNLLGNRGIKLELSDDGADYPSRLQALKDGTVDLSVFTVDALVKTSAELGSLPATGVMMIDETKGADALLSYKSKYPNIDAMNNPQTRFLLVKDSPSEMILRLMRASFNLDKLSQDCVVYAKDGEEVFSRFRQAKPTDDFVYITWAPYVQKMLDNPNVGILIDSSNFRGYIVDWLVSNREFLKNNREIVKDVMDCYFRASFEVRERMVKLILDDASSSGTPLSDKQARALTSGIWWKNVQENYGHMGIDRGTGLLNIEDIIQNITSVLLKSRSISVDPTNGQYNLLYYNQILQDMKDAHYHPGDSVDSSGVVRNELSLKVLGDKEWDSLRKVGTLQVEDIVFRRGTADLQSRGISVLDELVKSLNTWTSYYVSVRGDAGTVGDVSANLLLAENRAKTVSDYLISKGIDKNRVRSISGKPSGTTRVSFVLGQVAY